MRGGAEERWKGGGGEMIWIVNGCSGRRKEEIGRFRKVERER